MEHKQKKTSKPYSPEFRERAVRLLMEHRDDCQSEAAALTGIAGKLGCSPDSLRVWARQVQRDGGERPGPASAEKARIKELERENRELRQGEEDQKTIRGIVFLTNGILRKASAYSAQVRKAVRHGFSTACSGSTARFANDGFRCADLRFIEESREALGGPRVRKLIRGINFPDGRQSAGPCGLPLRLIMTGAPSCATRSGHRAGQSPMPP